MQNDERNHEGSDIQRPEDGGPEPRTTAFGGHSCEQCGGPLTGRKVRFCSDRCRMRNHRQTERRNLEVLFEQAERALADLRREVLA